MLIMLIMLYASNTNRCACKHQWRMLKTAFRHLPGMARWLSPVVLSLVVYHSQVNVQAVLHGHVSVHHVVQADVV